MKLTLVISLLTSGGFLSRTLTTAQGVVEGFEGGAVVLPCTVSIQGDLRWRVSNGPIIIIRPASGTALPPEKSSPWKDVVSFVGSSNNLNISPLSHERDDNRHFWCDGSQSGRGQDTAVRVLAKITGASIEASGGQVTVTEGKNITLTCRLTGNPDPPPSYSWRVNSDNVTGQGSTYNLTANRSMKSISCTATNKYSNGSVLSTAEATATLNVLYGPGTPRGGETQTAQIAGGVAGAVVLIAVIILVIVVLLKRRSGGEGRAGGKDEKTSVNEQLVGNSEKSAFSDPSWKQRDAEVADNELYEGTPSPGKLPPQDKRPPKPVRTFEHNSLHEPSHSTAPKDGVQEMEMAENAMNASDPKTKTQKNGATNPKKGKPGIAGKLDKTAKTQLPVDDSYEPTDFASTGANNNNPPAPQRQKLNYQEVAFDTTKKPPKSHPQEYPTEYADIKFSQRQ